MIQNADDAKASEVQFFLDNRSLPTTYLVHPELAVLQGPSLMAYNDGVFTDSDWENIQKPMNSEKAENPYKVGKFGIGFNSVYHLTDNPVILSGNSLAFFDPVEKVWGNGQPGLRLSLKDLKESFKGSLSAFEGLCGFPTSSHFAGTFFRLSFRQTPSEISETVFKMEGIRLLVEALREDAYCILMFLRSVTRLKVTEILEDGTRKLMLSVDLTTCSIPSVRTPYPAIEAWRANLEERIREAEFFEKNNDEEANDGSYHEDNSICESLEVTVEIFDDRFDMFSIRHWHLVTLVGSPTPEVRKLSVELKTLPWVSVAAEIYPTEATTIEFVPAKTGRICCFLPMPPEFSVPLPVLVNGNFSLTEDRRSIKFPGTERQNDSSANLNCAILKTILPSCYFRLIMLRKEYQRSLFYSVWPLKDDLDENNFKPFFEVLEEKLIKEEIVYFPQGEERPGEKFFVGLPMTIIVPWKSQVDPLVVRVLLDSGEIVVDLDPKLRALAVSDTVRLRFLSPAIVRDALRQKPSSYNSLAPHEKQSLLSYILEDGNCRELDGISLLPLITGEYVALSASSGNYEYYLCSSSCPSTLLSPWYSDHLIEVADERIFQELKRVTESNFNFALLSPKLVSDLLSKKSPKLDWVPTLWNWIGERPAEVLELFCGQKILPIVAPDETTQLTDLSYDAHVVFLKERDLNLERLLGKSGVSYTSTIKFRYLLDRVQQYAHQSTAYGILLCLREPPVFDYTDAKYFRMLLLHDIEKLRENTDARRKMQSFRIFETIHKQLMCIRESRKCYVIHDQPPILTLSKIPATAEILDCCDGVQQLFKLVPEIVFLSAFDFLLQVGFPIVEQDMPNKNCSRALDEFMIDCLLRLDLLLEGKEQCRKEEFLEKISSIKFVSCSTSIEERKAPKELFSIKNQHFASVFHGENRFPVGDYTDLAALQRILKQKLSASEILTHFKYLSTSPKITNIQALLCYVKHWKENRLELGPDFFEQLTKLFCSFAVLPVLSKRPNNYPDWLPWAGEQDSALISLDEALIYRDDIGLACGSACLFVDVAELPSEVLDLVQDRAILPFIGKQLALIISFENSLEEGKRGSVKTLLQACYTQASLAVAKEALPVDFPKKIIAVPQDGEGKWTFLSPDDVAFRAHPSFAHSLDPFLYIHSRIWDDAKKFFEELGVRKEITHDQIIGILARINLEESCKEYFELVAAILHWASSEPEIHSYRQSLYFPVQDGNSLHPIDSVVYFDNPFFEHIPLPDDIPHIVHRDLSPITCSRLSVPPLSQYLNLDEEIFDDVGQSEPLVNRLKGILAEYPGGVSIVKELLQNADDCGATELNIVIDYRRHNCMPGTLIFPDMESAHGPALIAHNNGVFTDKDFQNIAALAGATKANDEKKIGEYGLGFCSVYHYTDVPSILSQKSLLIFDPTLCYLKKQITNPSKPGKKITFTAPFLKNSTQLLPYEGLFGFSKSEVYKGTIFRFPFRTEASEISNNTFGTAGETELIRGCTESASKLLLFLRNICKLTISRIDKDQKDPILLLQVEKKFQTDNNECDISVKTSSSSHNERWITTTRSSTGSESYKITHIASRLVPRPDGELQAQEVTGEVFCFLPLGKETGLPFHVNANFAVAANRLDLRYGEDARGKHNQTLMEEYLSPNLIDHLLLLQKNKYLGDQFYSLWPLYHQLKVKDLWSSFLDRFYRMLKLEDYCLFYSSIIQDWVNFDTARILSGDLLGIESSIYKDILTVIPTLGFPVIDLPRVYESDIAGIEWQSRYLLAQQFFDTFFCKIHTLDIPARDQILLRMMKDSSSCSGVLYPNVQKHLMSPCVPVLNDSILQKCSDLVDPKAPFASLFTEEDKIFPALQFQQKVIRRTLKKYGLIRANLTPDLALRVMKQVAAKYDKAQHEYWMNKVKLLLRYLPDMISNPEFSEIAFLPAIACPPKFPLTWAASVESLYSVSQLFHGGDIKLVAGSVKPLIDDSTSGCGEIPTSVKIRSTFPIQEVVVQFLAFSKKVRQESTEIDNEIVKQFYHAFTQELKRDQNGRKLASIQNIPSIWIGQQFVHANFVANKWGLDSGPCLFRMPKLPFILQRFWQIPEYFPVKILVGTLQVMKCADEKPTEAEILLIKEILKDLADRRDEDWKDLDIVSKGLVPLPDQNFILRDAKDLTYHDISWQEPQADICYVSEFVLPKLALFLKVKAARRELANKYLTTSHALPFGQHEELTTRLQSILRDYPYGVGIIKELIQNADDAKATQLHIFLDHRMHKTSKLLDQTWQELQGPAMLVWNDSIFSESDIKAIQHLGLGNKRAARDTIGEFGIGFNSNYHLTDCPSFVSGNKDFCIFDPHSRYVPDSSTVGARFNLQTAPAHNIFDDFPDMKAAYLREAIDPHIIELVNKGSLFRFPLRKHSFSSKISERKPIISNLQKNVAEWMPEIELSLLFLLHLEEIKVFSITDAGCTLQYSIIKQLLPSKFTKESLCQKLTNPEAPPGCFMISVSVTFIDNTQERMKKTESKWFINHGRGNIERDSSQIIQTPKLFIHSIALPRPVCDSFRGRICRFLPLPIQSTLPVHINCNFILGSDRRGIQTNEVGAFIQHNLQLLEALGASYVLLLEILTTMDMSEYIDKSPLEYYKYFPSGGELNSVEGIITSTVYKLFWKRHSSVLLSLRATEDDQSHYFMPVQETPKIHFSSTQSQNLLNICLRLGMKITSAPSFLLYQLNSVKNKYEMLSPTSISTYLLETSTSHYHGMDVKLSPYQTATGLSEFLRYVENCLTIPLVERTPLLLTANGYLSKFMKARKLLRPVGKSYESLLPISHLLIHPGLQKIFAQDFFLTSDDPYMNLVLRNIFSLILDPSLKVQQSHAVFCSDTSLISILWEFLLDNQELFKKVLIDVLHEWAVLPLNSGGYCNLSSDRPLFANLESNFYPIAKKYALFLMDQKSVAFHLMTKLRFNFGGPNDILTVIRRNRTDNSGKYILLEEDEISLLMDMCSPSLYNINIWKQLPVFVTTGGKYITWPSVPCYHIDEAHPYDLNYTTANFCFLWSSHKAWYRLVGFCACKEIKQAEMFDKFLKANLSELSPSELFLRLEYMKDSKVPVISNHSKTPLIHVDGRLISLSKFVPHHHPFFRKFKSILSHARYLPIKFQNSAWTSFLTSLGLSDILSPEFLIHVCKYFASKKSPLSVENFETLCYYIDTESIMQLRSIPFMLTSEHIRDKILPYNPADQTTLVTFNGSYFFDNADLVWSVKPILHQIASTLSKLRPEKVEDADVISHLKNISHSKYSNVARFLRLDPVGDQSEKVILILDKIFSFLANRLDFVFSQDIACIPICIEGQRNCVVLVPPSRIYKGLEDTNTNEYYPFLHVLPTQYRKFFSSDIHQLSPLHLQLFLMEIQKQSSSCIFPTQDEQVKKAIHKLIKLLKLGLQPSLTKTHPLYLLTEAGSLISSTTLQYDELGYIEYDKTVTLYHEFSKIVQCLPDNFKPTVISSLSKLRYSGERNSDITTLDALTCGMTSVLAHSLPNSARELIQSLRAFEIPKILVEMEINGEWKPIANNRSVFLEINASQITLFFERGARVGDFQWLATILIAELKNLGLDFSNKDSLVEAMDIKSVADLEKFITRKHIQKIGDINMKWETGADIPAYLLQFLSTDLSNNFFPGELVAYQLSEGEKFILVQFSQLVSDEKCLIMTSPDGDPISVSLVELWKFVGVLPTEIVLVDANPGTSNTVPPDLENVIAELYKEILDLSQLPYEVCKKAFNKLLLKWHPDKNKSLIATEVTKYLLKQLAIIKDGSSIDFTCFCTEDEFRKYKRSSYYKYSGNNDSYSSETQHQPRHNYHGGYSNFSYQAPATNRHEGRRWIQQAEQELKIMEYVLEGNFYSHACFMAHQVVEKALKGGVYALVGAQPGMCVSHKLFILAALLNLHNEIGCIETYYLSTRYPNIWDGGEVPYQQYGKDEAVEAAEIARSIYKQIADKVG